MSHFITYLALEEAAAVDAESLAERYRSLYGEDAYAIQTISDAGPETEGQAFVVMMDKLPVSVMFIDKPLPADAYQEALALDLAWLEAREVMQRHQAHVIVALVDDPRDHLDNLNGAAAVTLVTGALATLLPTAALISTEGRVIMKPDMFGPLVGSLANHEIPVAFWVAMGFAQEKDADGKDTVRVLTYGLSPFIGREVECLAASMPAAAIAEWLVNLSHYLVRHGPVIKDQDQTSLTPQEMVRATYRAEGFGRAIPVIEFNMDETELPESQADDEASASVSVLTRSRVTVPEPMPVQDYEAPAKRQVVVFGKRGALKPATAPAQAAAQTKGPAGWPGLRLFARK